VAEWARDRDIWLISDEIYRFIYFGDEGGTAPSVVDLPDDSLGLHVIVDGVSKRYGTGEGSVLAVDDVSLTVERGAVVGLLGPNGAGKTTLIKSILGTVLPDAGTIRLFGTDVRADRRAAYADVDAMLEGARNDYWRLTVRENLRYFATIGGVDPDSVAARHDRLLDRLGLADEADTPVRDLSRGMKQKVSLASVLAGNADVVFLGMASPKEEDDYASYYTRLQERTAGLPPTVFVLAAEEISFREVLT